MATRGQHLREQVRAPLPFETHQKLPRKTADLNCELEASEDSSFPAYEEILIVMRTKIRFPLNPFGNIPMISNLICPIVFN